MDDIMYKMEQAKKQAREYEEADMNEEEGRELFDVADLIEFPRSFNTRYCC